jgi:hypothetical protein
MPLFAIAKLSDMGTRSDAPFHIERVRNRPTVDRLLAMPPDSMERLLTLVPPTARAVEAVIRGNGKLYAFAQRGLKGYSREEKAVFIAICLQEIRAMETQAKALETQAAETRARKAEIESLLLGPIGA